jgi:short-subunit dehydrogenase
MIGFSAALKEFQAQYLHVTGQAPGPVATKYFQDRAETELAHSRHSYPFTVQVGVMREKTKSGRAELIEVIIDPQNI